jgi:hypothetical protein
VEHVATSLWPDWKALKDCMKCLWSSEAIESNIPEKTGSPPEGRSRRPTVFLHKIYLKLPPICHNMHDIYYAMYHVMSQVREIFSLDGQNTSALKAPSTAILSSTRAWHVVPTIRKFS